MPDLVKVRGTYLTAAGKPTEGHVVFDLSSAGRVPSAGVMVDTSPVRVQLDETGSFEVELLPTDTEGLEPANLYYLVSVELRGSRPQVPWPLLVPASAAPEGLDLSSVRPAEPVPTGSAVVDNGDGTFSIILT